MNAAEEQGVGATGDEGGAEQEATAGGAAPLEQPPGADSPAGDSVQAQAAQEEQEEKSGEKAALEAAAAAGAEEQGGGPAEGTKAHSDPTAAADWVAATGHNPAAGEAAAAQASPARSEGSAKRVRRAVWLGPCCSGSGMHACMQQRFALAHPCTPKRSRLTASLHSLAYCRRRRGPLPPPPTPPSPLSPAACASPSPRRLSAWRDGWVEGAVWEGLACGGGKCLGPRQAARRPSAAAASPACQPHSPPHMLPSPHAHACAAPRIPAAPCLPAHHCHAPTHPLSPPLPISLRETFPPPPPCPLPAAPHRHALQLLPLPAAREADTAGQRHPGEAAGVRRGAGAWGVGRGAGPGLGLGWAGAGAELGWGVGMGLGRLGRALQQASGLQETTSC